MSFHVAEVIFAKPSTNGEICLSRSLPQRHFLVLNGNFGAAKPNKFCAAIDANATGVNGRSIWRNNKPKAKECRAPTPDGLVIADGHPDPRKEGNQ
jgi:hypothetical protein